METPFNPVCPFCLHRVDQGEQMLCTRFPPTPIPIPQVNQISGEMGIGITSVFPTVSPVMTCGEFEDKEFSESEQEPEPPPSPINLM